MNRAFTTLIFTGIILMLSVLPLDISGQRKEPKQALLQQDMQEFLRQSEQLVRFMEFAFNTLGNPAISAREKDIIINQSYLKFFSSGKVQIEDDLVEGRFVVTNKDVQAYLKDIDFFFKNVIFNFSIEDISYNVNDKGQIFFIVTTTRNLSGKTVEGDTIYNNQARFIEINLDPDKRDLKIASIYTSKLSEKEDMRNWWKALSPDWRLFFAKGSMINGEFPLKDIIGFDDKRLVIERFQSTVKDGFVMESRRADTIPANPGEIYQEISRIWKIESIDISAYPYISNLEPLSKLTELRTINLSGTHVDDLTPLRNLTRLENLIIAGTYINELDPLRHAINLKSLDASNTTISDLTPLLAFPLLERLNLSHTKVASLHALSSLQALRDVRLNGTQVADLSPLSNASNIIVLDISNTPVNKLAALSELHSLERLHVDNTVILELDEISKLPGLQYLFIEGTNISDIQVLTGLPSLKRIYCDRTPITREKASRFIQENPDVLVIYESQALTAWWAGIPQVWKEVFGKIVPLSEPPTREELHEVSNIRHINISGNKEILSLSPLQQLLGLRSLQAAETNILTIETLKENIDLVELDIASTYIQSISVLSNLRILESLKMENTPVDDLSPLSSSYQLKHLNLDFTNVTSLIPLTSLNNLEMVICDGLGINMQEISKVYDANPNVSIVYQSEVLSTWWQSLPDEWINIFKTLLIIDNAPTRFQLHRLVDQHEIDISNTRGLQGIEALMKFHRLKVLKISNVQISDITTLGYLTNLRELYCSNNPINNLNPISKLDKLSVLDCSNTLVRDLSALRNLENLRVLNVSGTQVNNLRPLSNLKSLRQLDCYNTKIISLRPLENLKDLELLRCYNTRVWQIFVNRFMKAVPGCEVIYY